jgi:hypothetical protein
MIVERKEREKEAEAEADEMREGNERKTTKGVEKRGREQSTQMEGKWSGTINSIYTNRLDSTLHSPQLQVSL